MGKRMVAMMLAALASLLAVHAQEIRQGGGTTCNLQCTCQDETTGQLLPLEVIVGGVTLAQEVSLCDEVFQCRGCRACSTLCNCNTQTCVGQCFKPAGIICQDPHVKGYDGRTFDFQGADGAYYALISDQNVAVNMRTTWNGYDQSFIDQLGVALPDGHTVSVTAMPSEDAEDGSSSMAMSIDGVEVVPGPESASSKVGSAELSWNVDDNGVPTSAVISVPDVLTLRVTHNPLAKEGKRHLDVQTEYFKPACADPHGVLGQTLQGKDEFSLGDGATRRSTLQSAGNLPDNGLGGLNEDAFKVSSLFESDFQHSVFGKPCGAPSGHVEVFEWGGVTLRLHPLDDDSASE